jgi:hypothetical protein
VITGLSLGTGPGAVCVSRHVKLRSERTPSWIRIVLTQSQRRAGPPWVGLRRLPGPGDPGPLPPSMICSRPLEAVIRVGLGDDLRTQIRCDSEGEAMLGH